MLREPMKKAMTSERRVLILGGGVIGVTSAYALAKRGFEVTVVERQDGVGLETSFANGSLITPSMADPWAAPGLCSWRRSSAPASNHSKKAL